MTGGLGPAELHTPCLGGSIPPLVTIGDLHMAKPKKGVNPFAKKGKKDKKDDKKDDKKGKKGKFPFFLKGKGKKKPKK